MEYGSDGNATGATLSESLKTIEDGKVTLSKTIEQTGENAFDITLQVTTQQNLKEASLDPNAAMCLVFDLSNSMLYCGECHAGKINGDATVSGTHKAGCPYGAGTALELEHSRLTASMAVAKDLVDAFGANSGKGQRMMSVVFFWTDAQCAQYWVDASDAPAREALKAVIDTADDEIKTGTNHDAALMMAKNLLNCEEVAGINNKYVVLLTDGEPTGYNKESSESVEYITGYYNWNERGNAAGHAQESAAALLETGAEVYAVCYGADNLMTHGANSMQVGKWLKEYVASSDDHYLSADNYESLKFSFDSVIQMIEERVDLWTVIDPMGDYIVYEGNVEGDAFAFADNTLTWDLRLVEPVETTADDVTYYTYTLTYPISLDVEAEGFEFDKWYETNEATSLKYAVVENDEIVKIDTNYFNIPTVIAVNESNNPPTVSFQSGEASNISFMLIDRATGEVEFLKKIDIGGETSFEIPAEEGKISAVFVKQSTSGMFWIAEMVDAEVLESVIECLKDNNPSYKGHNAVAYGAGDHELEFKKGKFVTYTFAGCDSVEIAPEEEVKEEVEEEVEEKVEEETSTKKNNGNNKNKNK